MIGLEEPVTIDDIQKRFRFIVWLVMIGKVNDAVIIFLSLESFFHQLSATARMLCFTLTNYNVTVVHCLKYRQSLFFLHNGHSGFELPPIYVSVIW